MRNLLPSRFLKRSSVFRLTVFFGYCILIFSVITHSHSPVQSATVDSHQKISNVEGNFDGTLSDQDFFGGSVESIDDLNGDGIIDIAVGAIGDDDGASNAGAVWILFMNSDGTVRSHQKISNTRGNFTGNLDNQDFFGSSVAPLGDLDGDGIGDIVVGAWGDNDGAVDAGSIWILFLNQNGRVRSHQKISNIDGNFTGVLVKDDNFGHSVTPIGDLDSDGVTDIVVSARANANGSNDTGAVWVLFLNPDGTVKSHQKINSTEGNFTGILDPEDEFGSSVASIGDLDGDGITDILVGAWFDDDGGDKTGAVWILFLNPDGTVKSHQKISRIEGNFTGIIDPGDEFGHSVASIGDLDGDGINDIAVGAELDDDGADGSGAIWVLFLNPDGTVKSHRKISNLEGDFTGILDSNDFFGSSVASVGDLNGDMVKDIAVGAVGDDDGVNNAGSVWIIFLNSNTFPPQTPMLPPTPIPSPMLSPSLIPTSFPEPTPSPPSGKSFTFKCNQDFLGGNRGLEKLVLMPGDNVSCVLKITDPEHNARVKVWTNFKNPLKSPVRLNPIRGLTDDNGELAFTISAIDRGTEWVAWSLPDKNGRFEFNKKAYDSGLAWGMFVEVK